MSRKMQNMTSKLTPRTLQKCGGKNCYISKAEAEKTAEEQEMLKFAENLQLNVYRCQSCGKWHLTRSAENDKMVTNIYK